MWRRIALGVTVLASLAAGCDSGSSPAAAPSSGAPTRTASATPAPPPSQRLAQLAGQLSSVGFQADYRLRRTKPESTARLAVAHGRRSVRVDITTHGSTATLIVTPHGSFACSRSAHSRSCFRVARGDHRVPAPFNLAPLKVFTHDVARLAARPERYDVRAEPDRPGDDDVPPAECFRVRAKQPKKPHAPNGTYCFSAVGVLAAVTYPSGNSLVATSVQLTTPPRKAFQPRSSPTPLPGR